MGKVITLGEIMLRLSTNIGTRLPQSEMFQAHYGGGEANVAISLANYGHTVSFASKVPDNALGEAVIKHLQRYGVDTSLVLVGGKRLGCYYMETGVGERPASVLYDRSDSSFALLDTLEWDLQEQFATSDIFHISGITPALSQNWKKLTLELVKLAKKVGCAVSFDVNYRGKLWTEKEAGTTIKELMPYVDYCSAGVLDARDLLGISQYQGDGNELAYYYQEMQKKYPNISVIYSTKRQVYSASKNELTGTLWINQKYYESGCHLIEPIVDRVGGGDAFSAGILHGLLSDWTPKEIIGFATAASALKHTVHGDCNQFNQTEVERFLAAGSGKIIR